MTRKVANSEGTHVLAEGAHVMATGRELLQSIIVRCGILQEWSDDDLNLNSDLLSDADEAMYGTQTSEEREAEEEELSSSKTFKMKLGEPVTVSKPVDQTKQYDNDKPMRA